MTEQSHTTNPPACWRDEIVPAKTAREWVERAVASGRNPIFLQQSHGSSTPWEWWLHTREVDLDHDLDPGRLEDDWWDEAFAILDSMGRVIRAEDQVIQEARS